MERGDCSTGAANKKTARREGEQCEVSLCYNWLNFLNLTSEVKTLNCAAWGNGDVRVHHKWWFKHLPHASGRTNDVANNWWRYVIDINDPELESRLARVHRTAVEA